MKGLKRTCNRIRRTFLIMSGLEFLKSILTLTTDGTKNGALLSRAIG